MTFDEWWEGQEVVDWWPSAEDKAASEKARKIARPYALAAWEARDRDGAPPLPRGGLATIAGSMVAR